MKKHIFILLGLLSLHAPASLAASAYLVDGQEVLAVMASPPMYPNRMAARGQEGYCVVAFTINVQGAVENPQAVDCQPQGFERTSLKAINKFKFIPFTDANGNPVAKGGVKYKFSYKLSH